MKVIKFGAEWCNGCVVMRPRWKMLEAENPWLITEYHDYDTDSEAVHQYQVKSERLPVFIFIDASGNEITRLHGEIEKSRLKDLLDRYYDS